MFIDGNQSPSYLTPSVLYGITSAAAPDAPIYQSMKLTNETVAAATLDDVTLGAATLTNITLEPD